MQTVIEIKAKCENFALIKNILKSKNARYIGQDHQIDTYFDVKKGRLKLREGNIENQLIFYDRVNQKGPKQSSVLLFKTEPNNSLKALLKEALGVLTVVEKKRDIYFINNTKFHLDEVKNLGSFIEIEAIGLSDDCGKHQLYEECRYYLELFKIPGKDLIKESYSDMILGYEHKTKFSF
jgi:predicted adenylyl cyclase CyaB